MSTGVGRWSIVLADATGLVMGLSFINDLMVNSEEDFPSFIFVATVDSNISAKYQCCCSALSLLFYDNWAVQCSRATPLL